MIQLSVLKSVKRILTHKSCPDGMAAAMILHDCIPDAEIVFCQYGSSELAALEPRSGDLWVDFSPPRDRVEEWLPPNVEGTIVLDHHATAKDVVARFGDLGVYSDEPGVSGAVLAYREVWLNCRVVEEKDRGVLLHRIIRFSGIAGIRDTWQASSPLWQESCEQAEALRFWPTDYLLSLHWSQWSEAMKIGKVLVEKSRERDQRLLEQSYRFGNVLVVGSTAISDLADLVKREDPSVKVVVGFNYFADKCAACSGSNPAYTPSDCPCGCVFGKVQKLKVSLRAVAGSDVDVSAIASHFGGGGHKSSAGFVIDAPMSLNPYEFLYMVLA